MPVVLARPKTMDDAKLVGERVRDHLPVIMNLEATDDAMSQRIVDFVGGVVFALQGSISRARPAVYICSPADTC
jgi:cell division inhibitor SepF